MNEMTDGSPLSLSYLICLLQDWRLLVDVYRRMSSVDDVGSLLRCAVRRFRLRLVDWSFGGSRAVVGLFGWGWLVAGLNWAVKLGNSVGRSKFRKISPQKRNVDFF